MPSPLPLGQDAPRPAPPPEVIVDPRLLQANERTFLAWIRTAVGLMAFGFVIARLGLWLAGLETSGQRGTPVSVLVGASVLVFASLLSVASAARFVAFRNALRAGRDPRTSPALELTLSIGVGVMGVLLAGYLLYRLR